MSRTVKKTTFIEMCLTGDALLEEIDDYIDTWHSTSQKIKLHEYLGMTWEEYTAWVAEPDILAYIVTAHKDGTSLLNIINKYENLPMAARADHPAKAKILLDWLKNQGKM